MCSDRHRRPTLLGAILPITALLLVGACSSSGSDAVLTAAVTEPTATPVPVDDPDLFTEADPADAGGSLPGPPIPEPLPTGTVSDSVVDPIEPVPDTGVPGIESDDDFCRSWSEFAGSYQALTFAWAVRGGESAARLEIVATDTLTSAVEGLRSTLPAELETERQALTEDLPGPLLRRAERSREFLTSSGLDDATIAALGETWLAAVTDSGLESEDLTVTIEDPSINEAVDSAAILLLDELPPIVEDPTLIVDVQIPATETYLFENCPDKGILAGNDNVDV